MFDVQLDGDGNGSKEMLRLNLSRCHDRRGGSSTMDKRSTVYTK